MSYISEFRAKHDIGSEYSDQEIFDLLPQIDPQRFGGLTSDQVAEAATNDSWEITKGFKAGVDQIQGIGYGLIGMAGDAAGIDSVKNYGIEGYQRNQNEARVNQGNTQDFTDINDIGSATDWAMYNIGQLAPNVLPMMATGGIGAAAAKAGAKKAVEASIKSQVAKGITAKVAAENAVKSIVAPAVARATTAGSMVGGVGMSMGEIYGDTEDAGVAALHGIVAGSLDALPVGRVLNKFGISDVAAKGIARNMAKEGITQAALEGGTEALQTLVEQHAKYWVETEGQSLLNNTQDINWNEIGNAAAAGALGGGVMGGATGGLTARTQIELDAEVAQAGAEVLRQGGDALSQEAVKAQAVASQVSERTSPTYNTAELDIPTWQRNGRAQPETPVFNADSEGNTELLPQGSARMQGNDLNTRLTEEISIGRLDPNVSADDEVRLTKAAELLKKADKAESEQMATLYRRQAQKLIEAVDPEVAKSVAAQQELQNQQGRVDKSPNGDVNPADVWAPNYDPMQEPAIDSTATEAQPTFTGYEQGAGNAQWGGQYDVNTTAPTFQQQPTAAVKGLDYKNPDFYMGQWNEPTPTQPQTPRLTTDGVIYTGTDRKTGYNSDSAAFNERPANVGTTDTSGGVNQQFIDNPIAEFIPEGKAEADLTVDEWRTLYNRIAGQKMDATRQKLDGRALQLNVARAYAGAKASRGEIQVQASNESLREAKQQFDLYKSRMQAPLVRPQTTVQTPVATEAVQQNGNGDQIFISSSGTGFSSPSAAKASKYFRENPNARVENYDDITFAVVVPSQESVIAHAADNLAKAWGRRTGDALGLDLVRENARKIIGNWETMTKEQKGILVQEAGFELDARAEAKLINSPLTALETDKLLKLYDIAYPETEFSMEDDNVDFTDSSYDSEFDNIDDVMFSRRDIKPAAQAANAGSLETALNTASNTNFNRNRDLKVHLQQTVNDAAKADGIDLTDQSERTKQHLVGMAVSDAIKAMEDNSNAIGWYDHTVKKALAILTKLHPELAADENAKFRFTFALAVTSNGLKVDKNFELAEKAYRAYKATGNMPTDIGIGDAADAINKHMALFNDLNAKLGEDDFRKFMGSKFSVRQLGRMGHEAPGELAETEVYGSMIIGPKIGNGFFSNLHGKFDQLTIDRWFMRTWGRWTGTLIESRPDMVKQKRAELKAAIQELRTDSAATKELQSKLGFNLTVTGLDELAVRLNKASTKVNRRKALQATKAGDKIRLAANGLAKYLDGQKEAPNGGNERAWIREVFTEALGKLQDSGYNLTMADLQALLWYPEKRLYDLASSEADAIEGYADDEAPDYANAAAKLARNNGVSDAAINSAIQSVGEQNVQSTLQPGTSGRASSARRGEQGLGTEHSGNEGFTSRERSRFLKQHIFVPARRDRSYTSGSSKPYKRASRATLDGLRVLKHEPSNNYAKFAADVEIRPVTLFELPKGSEAAQIFRDAITQSKEGSQFGAAVYVYPLDNTTYSEDYSETGYSEMRLFLSEDKRDGFALKADGDIVSVFSQGGGAAHTMLDLAIQEGGTKLDAFDTVLPRHYSINGFREIGRDSWNEDYKPGDWNKDTFRMFNNGEPDVVYMEFDANYDPFVELATEQPDFSRRESLGTNDEQGSTQKTEVDQRVSDLEAAINRSQETDISIVQTVLDTTSERGRAAEFAQLLADKFNTEITFVETSEALFDGVHYKGNIYVDVNSDTAYNVILGHELVHKLKRDNKELYDHLVDIVYPNATDLEGSANRHFYEIDSEKAVEEYVADVVGSRFGESEFWDAMAQNNPGKFKQIARIVRSLLQKVVDMFRHSTIKQGNAVKDINRMRTEIAKVMSQYANQTDSTLTNEQFKEQAMFSLKSRAQSVMSGIEGSLGDRFKALRFQMQDKYIDLKDKQRGLDVADEANAYQKAAIWEGVAGEAINDFDEAYVQPILELVAASGKSLDEIGEFLVARHAKEANAYLAEINPDKPDSERYRLSGMSNEDAAKILRDNQGDTKLQEIAQKVDEVNQARVDLLVKKGRISQDMADKWNYRYKHYVPLKREEAMELNSFLGGRGQGFSLKGKEGKQRTGSAYWSPGKILSNVFAQYEKTVVETEKNEVSKALLNFVEQNPDENFWEVVEDRTVRKTVNGKVIDQSDMQERPDDLTVWVDGERKLINFNLNNPAAKRLVSGLKNLQAREMNTAMKALASVTRFLATVNTSWNPEFMITNFARDIQTAAYNLSDTELKNMEMHVIADVPKAMKGIWKALRGEDKTSEWSQHWEDFRKHGGKTGWIDIQSDIKVQEKKLQDMVENLRHGRPSKGRIKQFLSAVEDYNNVIENAVRLAAYKNAVEQGLSKEKAAALAKDLTVNFNRKGAMGPTMNAFYMFFNAAVQGNARLLQAMVKSKKGRKLAAATVGFAVMLDIINRSMAGEDEDGENLYDALPAHVKDRNIIIWGIDGGDEPLIKIPAPWGYNVLHVIGQEIGSAMTNDRWDGLGSASHVALAISDAFNPLSSGTFSQMVAPTIIDPIVQIESNTNWNGLPLKPEHTFDAYQPKPEYQMHFSSARETSKELAKWLNDISGGNTIRPGDINISPEDIDLVIDYIAGGLGRTAASTYDVGYSLATGKELETGKIPFVRKVTGYKQDYGVKGRYYDWSLTVAYAEDELKSLKGEELIEARKRPEASLVSHYKLTEKRLRALRKQRKNLEANGNEEQVKLIDEKINQVMATFNKRYAEIMFD